MRKNTAQAVIDVNRALHCTKKTFAFNVFLLDVLTQPENKVFGDYKFLVGLPWKTEHRRVIKVYSSRCHCRLSQRRVIKI